MNEGLKDIAVIATPFLIFMLTVVAGVIGWSVKNLVKDLKKEAAESKVKAERVERDFLEFKASLPKQYVLKDDYIRTISGFEYKLDTMAEKIDLIVRRENGSKTRIPGPARENPEDTV